MSRKDFRSFRRKLRAEDFALVNGPEAAPTDRVDRQTWRNLTSLQDDVSLRTSDHFGTRLKACSVLWSGLVAVMCAIQDLNADSALTINAMGVCDDLQSALHNAMVGHYRIAFTSLRACIENTAIAAMFDFGVAPIAFKDYTAESKLSFGNAADRLVGVTVIASLERRLLADIGDNLLRQRSGTDPGGYARRLFAKLSKYAHASPDHTDFDLWKSNGPVFDPKTYADWTECYFAVGALSLLLSRLAAPDLSALRFPMSNNAQALFQFAVEQLSGNTDAKAILAAIPAGIW